MRRALPLAVCWAMAALDAQSDLPPDLLLLARIKVRMEENLTRLPNYTCVQTIERSRRRAPDHRFELVDTLRLEVALVNNQELFAWPGAKGFEERELSEMVGGGTIGNGSFALHAKSVFLSPSPTYRYVGEEEINGRPAARFDYNVTQMMSGYRLKVPPNSAIVAYFGSFWVDRETLDLIRLVVKADDIPPHLGILRVSDSMDYARMPIGESEFLLPQASELVMTGFDGSESRNRTRFSNCRQYLGESALSFADPPDLPVAPPAEPQPLVLPAGAPMELQLETEIDTERAAVGDPVQALLARPIKREKREVAPKGATVLGRIVGLKKHTQPYDHFEVWLSFDTLEFGGRRAEFRATMKEAGPAHGLLSGDQPAGFQHGVAGARRIERVVVDPIPGKGTLIWKGSHPRVPRGLRMLWIIDAGEAPQATAPR